MSDWIYKKKQKPRYAFELNIQLGRTCEFFWEGALHIIEYNLLQKRLRTPDVESQKAVRWRVVWGSQLKRFIIVMLL